MDQATSEVSKLQLRLKDSQTEKQKLEEENRDLRETLNKVLALKLTNPINL